MGLKELKLKELKILDGLCNGKIGKGKESLKVVGSSVSNDITNILGENTSKGYIIKPAKVIYRIL